MSTHQLTQAPQIYVKTEPERANPGTDDEPPLSGQHLLHQIHEYLVKISQYSSTLYDESAKHQSAYLSEHQKLLQSVAVCDALAQNNQKLQQENDYYKQEVLPQRDCLIDSQKRDIHEVRIQARTFEVRAAELEKSSSAEREEHKKAARAAKQSLKVQSEKIKELMSRIIELSANDRASPDPIQSPSKQPVRKVAMRRCKQIVPGAHTV